MQGFGVVVADGAIFHADWEARLFALAEVTAVAGITSGHFREAIESMPPSAYLAATSWADAVARGEEAPPEALYAVRFCSEDLFGAGGEPPFYVFVDLSESYLTTA
jgi:hypothetical protein